MGNFFDFTVTEKQPSYLVPRYKMLHDVVEQLCVIEDTHFY